MRLHWHRQDLRLADNVALAAAADPGGGTAPTGGEDGVLGLFVLDEDLLAHAGPPRTAFLRDALGALGAAYRERDGALLVTRGDPPTVVPAVATAAAQTASAGTAVGWNADYTGYARRRDAAVERVLDATGVDVAVHHDAVCHPPGDITTAEGRPYRVFSYFGEKWLDRSKPAARDAPDADALVAPPAAERLGDALAEGESPGAWDPTDDAIVVTGVDDLDAFPALTAVDPDADVPPAGTDAARGRLASFCDGPIYRYAAARDRPAERGTSRLSPHLALGTVGVREVYEATERAAAGLDNGTARGVPEEVAPDAAREGVAEFRRQLAWREFYTQVLAAEPETAREDHVDFERPVDWNDDPEGFAAWRDGETGFPLVDAGMRQLAAEGFVHNRVRMVVASFLTKDLLIDWRRGYAVFRERLVDHDTANDVGGWQWAASTGVDAQPFFRVFNPSSQCERHDPDGEYVRRWVPELSDVPAARIHEWPDLAPDVRAELAPGYPDPIVDHAERREAAIAAFRRARGEADAG
ncbi:MAG: deoxyribodipyrimidine photo-lyase [Halobacteriaceae archaeon]